jgi:hypothetical protein
LQWLKRVFDPETKERANGKPRVLMLDGFGTYETLEILEYCFANNIILCRLPSHTSHKLQPCDVAVFGPLKTAYRDQVERLEPSTGTVRRGRKRKSTALEVEANWPDVETSSSVQKGDARVSNVQEAEATGVLWTAPIAKMY